MGAPLPETLTIDMIMQAAAVGRPDTNMASFRDVYSPEQLHDVATYIKEVVLVDDDE